MSRSCSIFTFGVGALLAGACSMIPVVSTGVGCASQETSSPADAALPACNRGPFLFTCDPVAATVDGCNTDDQTSRWLLRLQRGARFSVGCVANFVGERDEQGDCELDAVCKCEIGPVTTSPPAGDVDGGEAGAPNPGPTAAKPRPLWNCSP